jgi:hypothetical protein
MGSFVRFMVKYLFLVLAALGVVDLVRQDILWSSAFVLAVCCRAAVHEGVCSVTIMHFQRLSLQASFLRPMLHN